ncbi:MAG: hypothetical protein WB660_21395 [Candidatus Sulfotelmatobacter sp.]
MGHVSMSADVFRARSNPVGTLSTPYYRQFRVGGVTVQVASDHLADVTLVPSLLPFRVDIGPSDINIQVGWVAKCSPASGHQLFDSGSLWRLYEAEDGLQFDFSTPILGDTPYKRLLVDDQFSRASLLLSQESFKHRRAPAPLEYPLDEVLITHRLTREKAIELHGCGIVPKNGGAAYLFVGHCGAGKSTTARLWTSQQDVQILSDDRIILREHAGQMSMYGTPWHGEAAYASPASAPLSGIFVLEHGRGNAITRFSRSQTVSELFARSFVPFHRHEYVNSALDVLQRVADTVPCYRYSFEPDQRAVDKILRFHD